jgi:hypothetical protein
MAPSFTTSAKLRSSQKDVLVGTSFLTVDPNLVTFTAEAWNPSTLIETNDVPFRTQSQHLLSNFLDWASFWSIGPKTFPSSKSSSLSLSSQLTPQFLQRNHYQPPAHPSPWLNN